LSDNKKKRFTEEQLIRILKAHEGGRSARELCRESGISKQTIYRIQQKHLKH